MDKEWKIIFVALLLWLILTIGLISLRNLAESKINYELDNGALCNEIYYPNGGVIFSDCSDGKTYLNPDDWKEIKG